jgi:osmotically inducible protein OsmC
VDLAHVAGWLSAAGVAFTGAVLAWAVVVVPALVAGPPPGGHVARRPGAGQIPGSEEERAMLSKASAQWEGDLVSGKGRTSAASGTFRDAGLSWKARTEGAASATTPEELLAASHASCFSMALSHGLAQGGHPPTRIETTCLVEFGPKKGGGFEVRSSALEVKGWVPGIDQAAFEKAAEDAKNGCPISSALRIPMSVRAALQR